MVYKIDHTLDNLHKVIGRTQAGVVFGQVSSLNLSENGQVMVMASDSGELMSYDLRDTIKTASDE